MNQHVQASIDAVRTQQQADAARIRQRRDLTPQAKRERLKAVDDTARKQMAELQDAAAGVTGADRRSAHRNAFGLDDLPGGAAANAFAHRDAQRQVASITTSRDAAALYAQADAVGDEVLARAVAAHAVTMASSPLAGMERGWVELLNGYVSARPEKQADVQALLDSGRPTGVADIFAFAVPPSNDAA